MNACTSRLVRSAMCKANADSNNATQLMKRGSRFIDGEGSTKGGPRALSGPVSRLAPPELSTSPRSAPAAVRSSPFDGGNICFLRSVFSDMGLRYLLVALPLLSAVAAGQPLAKAPFEAHKDLIFADFLVNGAKLNIVVDSGSSRCVLDIEKAMELGLNIDKVALSSGPNTVGGARQVRIAEGVTFQLGEVRVTAPVTIVYSLASLAKRVGRPIHGIIGFRVLEAFVLELDYPRHEIRIHHPDAFTAPTNAHAISLRTGPGGLEMTAKIQPSTDAPPVEGAFGVDTGASGVDVVLWKPCTDRNEIAAAARTGRDVDSVAFGGERPARQGRLARLEVGGVVVIDPTARFTDVYASGDKPSALCGNLASGFFRRFNVVFDFPGNTLWLGR